MVAPWRKWRSTFNPGFSPRNVVAMVPELLEEMLRFSNNLEKSVVKDGSDQFHGTNAQSWDYRP
jgi:hypothetical protein